MNINLLQQKLVAVARRASPTATVPYAFEQRIMARLREQVAPDGWAAWAKGLWRAVAPCMGIMVVLGVWTFGAGGLDDSFSPFDAELEKAVYAVLDNPDEAW